MTKVLLIGTGAVLLGVSLICGMTSGYLRAQGVETQSNILNGAAYLLASLGGWLIYLGGAL